MKIAIRDNSDEYHAVYFISAFRDYYKRTKWFSINHMQFIEEEL